MTFVDLLTRAGVQVSTTAKHSTAGWVNFVCPFCGNGSSNLGMGYHTVGHYVHCWKCGHHPLPQTLAAAAGLSLPAARQLLGDVARPLRAEDAAITRPGRLVRPAGVTDLKKPHAEYLLSRGLGVKAAARWGIMGIGIASRLAWSLYIPVTLDGEEVSWTTRALGNTGMRYVGAGSKEEKVPRKRLLYGEDFVRHQIVIVEGPLDAVRIGPGAVATMGVSYSRHQLLRLSHYPSRAVLFDNEAGAQRRARKLVRELEAFPGTTHLVELDAKDPGEASDKEIRQVRKYFLE